MMRVHATRSPRLDTIGLTRASLIELLRRAKPEQRHEARKVIRWASDLPCASEQINGWLVVDAEGKPIAALGYTAVLPGVREYFAFFAEGVTLRQMAVISRMAGQVLRVSLTTKYDPDEAVPELRRVQCVVPVRGEAAIRWAQRLGFRREGVLESYCPLYGSMVMMAMTRNRLMAERGG
jgi:RimJ/RimL family protein N-acetyltransferase